MLVCEAAGFDVVLIETVGVGQSETMVADMTDCFLALMLPGAGDELQGIKRGLLELVDVIAVNKADGLTRQTAELAAQQLADALKSLSGRANITPDVLTCSALHHEGVPAVWQTIETRYANMKASGELAKRHRQQSTRWFWSMIDERLRQAVREHAGVAAIREQVERDVRAGTITPESAARRILDAFGLPNRRELTGHNVSSANPKEDRIP
jgi:LAO/AO transport system kinase